MGEAKRKRQRHAAVLTGSRCIYCAGVGAAETVDHMPPRVMFRMSQRPKGMEFPSCQLCNFGTSRADLVAAFFARTFPGIENKRDETEWDRLLGEVGRVLPDLMQEMWIPERHQLTIRTAIGAPEGTATFFAAGQLAHAHMTTFAAKVGFALHFWSTGSWVPADGRVQVRWFTNEEVMNGRLPKALMERPGRYRFLQQGKITSEFDFEYGAGEYEDSPARLYFCKARQAFHMATFVVNNPSDLPFPEDELATFRPGEFQGPVVARIPAPLTKPEYLRSLGCE